MGMLSERLLKPAVFSPFFRNLCWALCRIPLVGGWCQASVRCALPHGTRFWTRVPGGLAQGLWLILDPRYEFPYASGGYEVAIQTYLSERLRPGHIFYDIGAHIGFFSLLAARLVGPAGAVFSFEPDPENFTHLRKNIVRNSFPQIQAINAAVWSISGHVEFRRASVLSSRNAGTVSPAPGVIIPNRIEVAAVRLDDFAVDNPPPAVVKIDVEGGEIEILKGALSVLSRWHPLILCEIHSPENLDALFTELRFLGYRIRPLSDAKTFPLHFLASAQARAHG